MSPKKASVSTDIGSYYRTLAVVSITILLVFAALTAVGFITDLLPLQLLGVAGMVLCVFLAGRYSRSPDRLTADQTRNMLGLANEMLQFVRGGMTQESAQEVCNLLLPATDAVAVAIFDAEGVCMGHAGLDEAWLDGTDPIDIPWARMRFEYGAKFVTRAEDDDNRPLLTECKSCIATPLVLRDEYRGTLKMYYRKHDDIDETQQAIAVGLASLLSTQLAVGELDAKAELATKMELRALQAQINPHFLFNTINTIAALIRTDPRQARILLREFAVFYRRTLESSQDLITIELELSQTMRYLGFERARFGADKILLTSHVQLGLEQLPVPAFIVQPIVENAVGHAMRPDGQPLHIDIDVRTEGDDVVIAIADDGVGMESAQTVEAVKKGSSKGAGIALKNVDDRLKSCFGKGSGIRIESQLGVGTTVNLVLVGAVDSLPQPDDLEDELMGLDAWEKEDSID